MRTRLSYLNWNSKRKDWQSAAKNSVQRADDFKSSTPYVATHWFQMFTQDWFEASVKELSAPMEKKRVVLLKHIHQYARTTKQVLTYREQRDAVQMTTGDKYM